MEWTKEDVPIVCAVEMGQRKNRRISTDILFGIKNSWLEHALP